MISTVIYQVELSQLPWITGSALKPLQSQVTLASHNPTPKESVFLDSPVQELVYSTGNTGTTDKDGLIHYFPGEPINLKLGNLDLGNFATLGNTLTPYDVLGVIEGLLPTTSPTSRDYCKVLTTTATQKMGFNSAVPFHCQSPRLTSSMTTTVLPLNPFLQKKQQATSLVRCTTRI